MSRFLCAITAVTMVGTVYADSAADVAKLVKQLGDSKFAVREAAQRELLTRGESIGPELDRLAMNADAETAERLRKIRYELAGYKDDIRKLLADLDESKGSTPAPIPVELRSLIMSHRPGAVDMLLSILADPKHALYRPALRTFLAIWDSVAPGQIDQYIHQSVTLTTTHRPRFPAQVGVMISYEARLRDESVGWPAGAGCTQFTFRARTTRYLDGKPYEKPYECPHPSATVGWYKLGALAEGKHTIRAVMEYEFTHQGVKRTGRIPSEKSTFEIVPADAPDDLMATTSNALRNQFGNSFILEENQLRAIEAAYPELPVVPENETEWQPQVTWGNDRGGRHSLTCPCWRLREPLPVDLCFDVTLLDVKTGTAYAADPIVVVRGQVASGYIAPRDVRAFAKGRSGFVRVKVSLRPSRALALTDLRITKYYPESITTGEFRMKVVSPAPSPPVVK